MKATLRMALDALESSRVFVTSREKIKHPEGTEWYDERIAALKAALECKYGNDSESCTSNPMDCQCAIDAALAAPDRTLDPRKHCLVYRAFGCAHIDGILCNVESCDITVDVKITPPQTMKLQTPIYPLPDSLYPDSKDWMASGYAERVEWLHTMYENKKTELDEYLDQAPTPLTADGLIQMARGVGIFVPTEMKLQYERWEKLATAINGRAA